MTSASTQSFELFQVNIYADPLTAEQLVRQRAAISATPSLGEKVAWAVPPIFGLDFVAGMAVEAIVFATQGDPQDPWRYVPGSAARDWSASIFTNSFAEKVRALGRELTQAEVGALQRHLEIEATAKSVAGTVGSALLGSFGIKL